MDELREVAVCENVFVKPFMYINDHCTKTGSGQT